MGPLATLGEGDLHGPPCSSGRGGSIYLKGTEPAWAQPSGLLLQQPGIRRHPQQVTVSPKFAEAEKVKQNEKAEELLSIERARENS